MKRKKKWILILLPFVLILITLVGGILISLFGKGIEPDITVISVLLVVVGLVYSPIYKSLTDKKFEKADYINVALAMILGTTLCGAVLGVAIPIDTIIRGMLTIPFLALGVILIALAIYYIWETSHGSGYNTRRSINNRSSNSVRADINARNRNSTNTRSNVSRSRTNSRGKRGGKTRRSKQRRK